MEIIGSLAALAAEEGWKAHEQAAMEAELLRGHYARNVMVAEQDKQARKEAAEFRDFHQKKGVFWKPVLSIPQQEYEEICEIHGRDFFSHRENIRWIQNKHPEFRAARV